MQATLTSQAVQIPGYAEHEPKDELSAVQMTAFTQLLQAMREEVFESLNAPVDDENEPPNAADPADRASQEEERTLRLSGRSRLVSRLQEIDAALHRLSTGDYGYCEETGEFIGLERLKANPVCRLSFEAQTKKERLTKIRLN